VARGLENSGYLRLRLLYELGSVLPTIAIPYVPMPAAQNPNTKSGRTDTYLVSSLVTFASLRRWNPYVELQFVTTEDPGYPWRDRFEEIGVHIRYTPFAHLPPEGFARTFMGSLYLLDVLESSNSDYLAIVDPDVFCVGPLESVISASAPPQALNIPSPRGVEINGLSPREADEIHLALGEQRVVDFHYGGEFYGVPSSMKDHIQSRVDRAWSVTLDRWSRGRSYFTTEEHVLNFALADLPVAPAENFIRRIWTAHSYRTVSGRENDLLLWHLPAEKDRGFRRLYTAATNADSWFWNSEQSEFQWHSGRAFGFHGRDPIRFTLDLAGVTSRAIGMPRKSAG